LNITREDVGTLQALLTLEVEPTDYKDRLKKAATKLGKELNIKGFRKGKVPRPVVIKMFGKRLLADELNDILSEGLENYLKENNIELIGRPIPKQNQELDIDLKSDKNYSFNYELGLKPEFELPLETTSVKQYKIEVSEEEIQDEIDILQDQNGKVDFTDEPIEERDLIDIQLQELADDGTEKEDGWYNEVNEVVISSDLKDEVFKQKLIGANVGDVMQVNVFDTFAKTENEIKKDILNLEEDAEFDTSTLFNLKITKVRRNILHPLNQELFDKVLGPEIVDSEEAFREEIREGIGAAFRQASEAKLARDIMDALIQDTEMELPHEFLKKMIEPEKQEAVELSEEEEPSSEPALSEEDLAQKMENFVKSVKWMLIRNKVLAEENIKIDDDEVFRHAVHEASMRLGLKGAPTPQMISYVENLVTNLMKQDQNYRNRKIEEVVQYKAISALKTKVAIDPTLISMEEFSEIQKN